MSSSETSSGLARITSASLDHMLCTGEEVSRLLRKLTETRADRFLARNSSALTAKRQGPIGIE
jgi:hypothetical protein